MNTIQEAKIEGKKVLLRVGFDLPIVNGQIIDDRRIRETIPTINYLLDHKAKEIILITHLGRPKDHEPEFSLWPVANKLSEILKSNARFTDPKPEYQITNKIKLLENLRFNKGEEENDPEFSKTLANFADIYIDDAFSVIHRDHASITGVAKLLPSYAGLLVQKEVENLEKILNLPAGKAGTKEKPFTIILGGAKIADKLPVIKNLISKADNFLIGGAIANTFLAARRHHMGKSLVEKDALREANIIWQSIMDEPDKNIYLPVDLIISLSEKRPDGIKIIKTSELLNFNQELEEYQVVDIGPKTAEKYTEVISKSKVIFWNGNMGISEVKEFADGTDNIAKAISVSKAQIVVGGGDTVAAVEATKMTLKENIFLSTGGGATLEFLAGKVLPGLKVLE